MTSTIKVDNIQKVSDGSNIIKKCGSTITIGSCGQTVAIAGGATTSGMGRTGTVDWVTTVKTADFTAVAGEGYFVNTTSGGVTMTLPSSPSAGAIISVKDYAYTFDTNALTIGLNGSKIGGGGDFNPTFETEGISLTLIYIDSTQGWLITNNDSDSTKPQNIFIAATGGNSTATVCTNFKVHTFTSPGTLCISQGVGPNAVIDYLVVAGGGGAGADNAGGAGGGGFRSSNDTCMSGPLTSPLANPTGIVISGATAIPITVGAGGASQTHGGSLATRGANSIFSTITSTGGGASPGTNPVAPGGSGSGARADDTFGTGNTPPVSPPQGNPGGEDGGQPTRGSGGGGGAGAAGTPSPPNAGGAGGVGSFMAQTGFAACNGTPGPVSNVRYFSGGGGGAPDANPAQPPGGAGGAGGGGAGSFRGGPAGGAGTTNTGGGGGGGGNPNPGASGGSGIVIVRYKFQ